MSEALTPFVPLSRKAGEGDYEVRKLRFRLMLKLRFSTPKGLARGPLSHRVGEGLGVRAKYASQRLTGILFWGGRL